MQIALLAIRNQALAGGSLPKAVTLLKYGDNPTDRGVFRVTDRSLAALEAQRAKGVFDRLLIDFEHNSLPDSKTYQPPPRHHAGAGMLFSSKERGIGFEGIEWTPKGEEYARNYPDISPAINYDEKTMEVVGMVSAGLVPNGGVIGLSFFSAQDPLATPDAGQTKTQEPHMEELKQQVEALAKSLAALQSRLDAMEQKPNPVEAMSAKTTELETKVAALGADIKAEQDRHEKALMLQAATFAGKAVALTDEAIAKLSVADLKAHIDALQPTVPVSRRTAATQTSTDGMSVVEQLNAITDPTKRCAFYAEHREKILAHG